MRPRIAWALAGVALALGVADIVVTAQYRPLLSEDSVAIHGFPLVNLAVLGCAVLGAVILTQDRRHPIGLLLSLVGVTSAVSLFAEAHSLWVVDEDGPGPRSLGGISGWVSILFGGQLAIAGLALMFLLAPDGRLLSRRWRWAVALTGLGALMCLVGLLSQDPTTYDVLAAAERQGTFASVMFSVGFLAIAVGLVASVVSMLVRLRRSKGEERQQVRLIALAAALIAAGLLNMLVVQLLNGGHQTWASALPLLASYMLLPVLFGVAVLRYRLYEVEVILNRTFVVVLGTAFAAVGYVTLVVTVGALVDSRTGGVWLSLLATVVVALAFQPLRRQVVRLANRLAYGSRAQPYEALWDFSHRIAETPTSATLLPAVAEAAGQAVSATGAAAVLHVPGAPPVAAHWGTSGAEADAHEVVVRHGKEELGSIRVWLAGGLRASDVRLLEALATQTAVVFHNVGLEAELAARVEELDRTTEDLARSRARIIAADDAARRAMEAAISREVLPHLTEVAVGIPRARAANASGATTGLDDLVTATNTALEALRDLTRGLFPTQLSRSGLEPALRSSLARSGRAGALHLDPPVAGRRFAAPVEAAVYSCTLAAAREHAELAAIEVFVEDDELVVRLLGLRHDGSDLQHVADRAEAVGGSLRSRDDGLLLRFPVDTREPEPVLVDGGRPDL